jgi:hypothetical protein
MIEFDVIKKITEFEEKKFVSITCDICGKVFVPEDHMEIKEFHHIRFTGGYGSVFGDGDAIECDICQYCLKDFLKDRYRVGEE